jgi:hypothetical protein
MLCQYSRPAQVSSGKRNRALDPGAADGGGDASDIATGTVIVGRSRAPSESLTVIARRAHADTRVAIADMREMVCKAHAAGSYGIRPLRCDAGMPPLLAVEDPGVDQLQLLAMRINL